MLEIHKQYVVDENGKAIAVQIPIEQFDQIEAILRQSEPATNSDRHFEQEEDLFEDKNGILVFNGKLEEGMSSEDLALMINRDREERDRKLMSW